MEAFGGIKGIEVPVCVGDVSKETGVQTKPPTKPQESGPSFLYLHHCICEVGPAPSFIIDTHRGRVLCVKIACPLKSFFTVVHPYTVKPLPWQETQISPCYVILGLLVTRNLYLLNEPPLSFFYLIKYVDSSL